MIFFFSVYFRRVRVNFNFWLYMHFFQSNSRAKFRLVRSLPEGERKGEGGVIVGVNFFEEMGLLALFPCEFHTENLVRDYCCSGFLYKKNARIDFFF